MPARGAFAIGGARPGRSIAIRNAEQDGTATVVQGHGSAGIGQAPSPGAEDPRQTSKGLQQRRVCRDNQIAVRRDEGVGGKRELDIPADPIPRQIDSDRVGVVQFNKLGIRP